MLPNTKVTISKTGDSKIEGLEHSDQCFKLRDIAKKAGKISSVEDKDHPPVYQNVNIK